MNMFPWGIVFLAIVFVLPMWRILEKAGFPPALSLISIIPVAILILLFVLAFVEWPALRTRAHEAI